MKRLSVVGNVVLGALLIGAAVLLAAQAQSLTQRDARLGAVQQTGTVLAGTAQGDADVAATARAAALAEARATQAPALTAAAHHAATQQAAVAETAAREQAAILADAATGQAQALGEAAQHAATQQARAIATAVRAAATDAAADLATFAADAATQSAATRSAAERSAATQEARALDALAESHRREQERLLGTQAAFAGERDALQNHNATLEAFTQTLYATATAQAVILSRYDDTAAENAARRFMAAFATLDPDAMANATCARERESIRANAEQSATGDVAVNINVSGISYDVLSNTGSVAEVRLGGQMVLSAGSQTATIAAEDIFAADTVTVVNERGVWLFCESPPR